MALHPTDPIAPVIDGAELHATTKVPKFAIDFKTFLKALRRRGAPMCSSPAKGVARDQERPG